MVERVYTPHEVAAILGVNVQTVRKYCHNNVIVALRLSGERGKGTRYRITQPALFAYLLLHPEYGIRPDTLRETPRHTPFRKSYTHVLQQF